MRDMTDKEKLMAWYLKEGIKTPAPEYPKDKKEEIDKERVRIQRELAKFTPK